MKIKKYLLVVAAGALLSGSLSIQATEINTNTDVETNNAVTGAEGIYNDSNVSISSALDRYIAVNTDSALKDLGVEKVEKKKNKKKKKHKQKDKNTTEETTVNEVINVGSYIDFSNKALVTASGQVNIRKEPDVNSDKVGIICYGGLVTIEEKGSEWSAISSGNCTGYISNELLAFGDEAQKFAENNLPKVAVINANTLRLRASESEDSECLTVLPGGEEYDILSQGDSWTKIEIDDTLSGYVNNAFIAFSYRTNRAVAVTDTADKNAEDTEEPTTQKATEAPADTNEATTEAPTEAPTAAPTEAPAPAPAPAPSGNAGGVVNYALQFVGNPYVYGGSSLTNGTDCSGFTMSVYANFGVSLPHSSAAQSNCGTEINLCDAQAGDLIFYTNGGSSIGHVALCIGGGQVVHAATESTGIIVSNMYYSTPCKAVRLSY